MKQLFLCLLSFFILTTNAQISKKNNILQTKKAGEFFHLQQDKKNGASRIVRSVQLSKTIHVTNAGTLDNLLTPTEKKTITNLTVTGNLDARDFRILRDSLVNLSALDISTVTVVSYYGSDGTGYSSYTTYPANEIPESAFYTSGEYGTVISGLTSILLPSSVTSVGGLAFAFCSSLSSISISSSLSLIGDIAFLGCSAFITVDEANPNYSSVDGVLFDKAKTTLIQCPLSITGSYDIPSTVQSIAPYSFCFCDRLTSVNIPSSVKSIGVYAFTSFSGIFNIDSNNTNYSSQDDVLFNKSASMLIQCSTSKSGSYSIPLSVDSIGNNSFYNCSLMTSVSIPSSVISIFDFAFYNCSGLTSITVNSLPVYIGSSYEVFYNVNTNTCILNVPFGTKSLYQSAAVWNSFTNIVENTHGFVLDKTKSILPSTAGSTTGIKILSNDAWTAGSNQSWLKVSPENGRGNDTIVVTADANPTTDNRKAIVTVSAADTQPQTITIIQAGIPTIINITAGTLSSSIPAADLSTIINLKITGSMDARDFKTLRDNMPDLAILDISEVNVSAYNGTLGTLSGSNYYSSNTIPEYAFFKGDYGFNSPNITLSSLKLPGTITSIGTFAFYSCEALTEITIPNSVTNIGDYTFGSCNALTGVTLSTSLTTIGIGAFIGGMFTTVTIPNTVTSIANQAFASCSKLSSISIPNSLTIIGSSVFQDCISLSNLNLSNSLISIGTSAFNGCTNLETVIIPNSVTLLDDMAFSGCIHLDSVKIGNSVTTIGYSCFQNCSNLSKVIIPNSVTQIKTYGFSSCTSLVSVSFNNGLKTIDNYAFSNCTALSSITVDSDIPVDLSTSYGVFSGVNTATCLLHVPFGAKNAYAAASQWKDFSNIIENTQGLSLESNSVKLSYAEGSSSTIKVSSNSQWSVNSNQTWLKVSPVTGTGNNSIVLTADLNASNLTRTAIVTVSTTGITPKTITVFQAASPKIVNIIAGGLETALTPDELNTVSSLTITGTIDSRDFKILRDNMPQLAYLDISAVSILAYNGSLGTYYYNLANTVPIYAFFNQNGNNGNKSLVSVKLPTTATKIESSAFQLCSGLINITIPNSITEIGYGAFNGCSGLKDIVLSTGMTRIQSSTFQNCTNLKNITIPNSITTIEYSAFQSCTGLDSIAIPNSVTTMGTGVFAFCSHLTGITLPNALTLIDGNTFSNCTSLQSITIPNSVTTIGYSSFLNCSKLTTVNFGSGVIYIGYSAFESCTSLNNISIPVTLISLESDIFKNCTSLTSINLPNSLTATGLEMFYGCTALKEITLPGSLKKIETSTFYNCTSLTMVNIPNSIKTIGDNAFYNCTSLNSIILPNSVNTVGNGAFSGCLVLSDISLGDSLLTIGSSAFAGCIALKSLSLPSLLTKIDSYSFTNCSGLTEIVIPNFVSTIGNYAFSNCSGLISITLPNSLKSIEASTFSECTKLTYVNIGNQVASIGDMAFESCTSLPSIIFPSTLKTIGTSAFYNCTSLLGITIPNSVVSINPWAFQSCSGLITATLSNSLKLIDSSVFYNCSGLTGIDLPNSVTSIGTNAFWGCSALATVTMGNSITTIYGAAFNGCNKLTNLSIPGSVTSIGYSAFNSCTGLKSITVNALIPVDLTNTPSVFYNVDKTNCSLHVPFNAKPVYGAANQWKDFLNIVENPYGLVLDTDSLNLSVKAGSSATVNVQSNTSWTASSDQSWLSVTPNSGSGNNAIVLTAEANPLLSTRMAVITVQASGIEPQLVRVTQDAATKTVAVSAGGLSSALTHDEHTVLNRLVITGTLDATDFKFMRDSIPNLEYLDISQTSIVAYSGANGTGYTYTYPAATVPEYAFYNSYTSKHNNVLKSILLPNTISSIGNTAFEYCSKLDSIDIPNSVTTLGDYSFNYCTNLKNVNIPGSLTTLGSVFGNCISLSKIVIPNSVTSLTGTFSNCLGIKDVTLSNTLTTIGGSSFYNCTGISQISIPNTVTLIDSYAFMNCSVLTSLTIGTSVNSIGSSAFSGCTRLTELSLPKSVKTIGDYAFQGCDLLSIVSIPESVGSIGYYAFSCSGLKSILSAAATPLSLSKYGVFSNVNKSTCTLYVPAGSKALYQNADQWKDFNTISEEFGFMLSNDTVRIQSGESITIDIPTTKTFHVVSDQTWLKASTVNGNGNTQIVLAGDINPDLFLRTSSVKFSFVDGPSQVITVVQSGTPKTVSISSGGLYKNLTADELKNVSNLILTGTIDARDFRVMRDSMPQLANIDLKNTTITAYSGSEGTNPNIGTYPANETPINSFYKTYSGVGKPTLASIILPSNITSIGQSSFAYARGLSSIIIPDQVTVINETAFARCEGLKDVTIGNSVTTIGVEAFYICTKLSEVSIPNSVTTISKEAFADCIALKSIIFSSNLNTIGTDAFVFCNSLTNVEIPNSVKTIETGAFRYCYKLARVVLPATLTELKYDVFYYCPLLKEIKLPETLKIIGPEAFAYCSGLSTISIPASVNNIGYNVFSNCTSLSSIYAYPISPVDLSSTSLSSNVFYNVNTSTCILYVPQGSKALYQAAVQWKDFTNIIELITATPTVNGSNITIYPNPVKESFTITGLSEVVRVVLTDINGKQVLVRQVNAGEYIPANGLGKGMYILKIVTSEGTLERKLIKE